MEDKLTVPPTSEEGDRDDGGGCRERRPRGRGKRKRKGKEGRGGGGPYSSSIPSYVELAGNLALGIWKMQLSREYIRGQNKPWPHRVETAPTSLKRALWYSKARSEKELKGISKTTPVGKTLILSISCCCCNKGNNLTQDFHCNPGGKKPKIHFTNLKSESPGWFLEEASEECGFYYSLKKKKRKKANPSATEGHLLFLVCGPFL